MAETGRSTQACFLRESFHLFALPSLWLLQGEGGRSCTSHAPAMCEYIFFFSFPLRLPRSADPGPTFAPDCAHADCAHRILTM